MISPENYADRYKDMSYESLLKIRDVLIENIVEFENNKDKIVSDIIEHPSPDVVYSMNLQYLAQICNLLSEKFILNN